MLTMNCRSNGQHMSKGLNILSRQMMFPLRVAVFLNVIGATTCGLLRSLLAPNKPGSKPYNDLVDILTAHFSSKPIIIAERFRFRNQDEGESVVCGRFKEVIGAQ